MKEPCVVRIVFCAHLLPDWKLALSSRRHFGKVVEWSITAVLKTAVLRGTGGSNPSLSAADARLHVEGCEAGRFVALRRLSWKLPQRPPARMVPAAFGQKERLKATAACGLL